MNLIRHPRLAESVLKAAKEGKRKTALERSALGADFEADGSLKAEKTALLDAFAEGRRLSVSPVEGDQGGNTAALDGRYVSHRVTGDRAVKTLKNGGARALTRELSEAESKEYSKLRRAMRTLDVASGNKLDYVLAEGMADKNAYFDPQTGVVVIGVDTLTADADGAAIKAWGQALVHEVTHTTEGTMGNAALAAQLSSIMGDEALYGELSRRGYFKGNAEEVKAFLEPIMEKVKQGTELTAEEAKARDLFLSETPALMAEKILGDGHFIRRLVAEQGSVAEKVLVKLTELKESLSRMTSRDAKSLHRAVVKAEGLYLKAVEEAGYRFEGGKFVGSEEDEDNNSVKPALRYTVTNKPVVVITENILDGVPEADWIQTVKDTISTFSPGIPVHGRLIKVNLKTKNEFTNSKDSRKLEKHDKVVYEDKFKSAKNLDEIVLASTNYINEDLNHTRKDKFVQFARGDVLIRVGGNDYTAKIIVGFTSGQQMVLYDIVDFQRSSFVLKSKKSVVSSPSNHIVQNNVENSSNTTDSVDSIHDSEPIVKGDSKKSSVKESRKPKAQTSVDLENPRSEGQGRAPTTLLASPSCLKTIHTRPSQSILGETPSFPLMPVLASPPLQSLRVCLFP